MIFLELGTGAVLEEDMSIGKGWSGRRARGGRQAGDARGGEAIEMGERRNNRYPSASVSACN